MGDKELISLMRRYTSFILLLFFVNVVFSQEAKYENLVFEGSGIRGIAYCGVLSELEKNNIIEDIVKVGGTSAGAITALMVALGYTSDEVFDIISDTKFQKFNDGQFIFVGGFSRLKSQYGWYKGTAFSRWLDKIIAAKTGNPDITFSELKNSGYKQLYVTATCLNKQRLLVFSEHTYPQMKVKDAVRISMSIPLYFEAVFIDSVGNVYNNNKPNLDVVVDGGIVGNYPIFIFDSLRLDWSNNQIRIPNFKTLGIRIDSDLQIKSDSLSKELVPIQINKMSDFLQAFYILILENLNRIPLIPEDWQRTISVSSVGISPKLKKLSKEQKESLVKSGEFSTKNFLNK
tara:strand:- start:596 stop:1630 length:1035 start_codon:yes stop_codon:yes gene_type:complete